MYWYRDYCCFPFNPTTTNSLYQFKCSKCIFLSSKRVFLQCLSVNYKISTGCYPLKLLNISMSSANYYPILHNLYGGERAAPRLSIGEPIKFSKYTTIGPVSIAADLVAQHHWQPPYLTYCRGNHPIDQLLGPSISGVINLFCRQQPDTNLVYVTKIHLTCVTPRDLQDLVSHGHMIRDSVLNVFLEILAVQTGVKYLNTFFLHIMDRDRAWRNLQPWFAYSASSRRPDHPMLSEPTILIPCHVNGNHWVALVQRMLHGRIYFLYSDDMNHPPTEYKLKQLFETTASKEFYPTNAIWINCKSTTFNPHSNECGPWTLLALTVLGLHPAPDTHSLLPFMAGNLARILQTWVASSIL
jgi:hypothetical protein